MHFIISNYLPLCVLSINLIVTISYYIIYGNRQIKEKFFMLPTIVQKLYVAVFVLPLFIAPFLEQTKFSESNNLFVILGIIVSIIGFAFIGFSFLKIGFIPSIKSKGGLSTGGVYGIVRHPIYAGTIIVEIGLNLVNLSMVSTFYILISIILYYSMTIIEEKDLIKIFGNQYVDYKKVVKKRIIPFII